MKYIRVVLAVQERDLASFAETLDYYIGSDDNVQGAYVSELYNSRKEALGTDWKQKLLTD